MPDYNQFFGIQDGSEKYHLLKSTLKVTDVTPHIKKFGTSTVYQCFFDQGVSLCFENSKLDSIDFYKQSQPTPSSTSLQKESSGQTRYGPVDKDVIPDFIDYESTGLDLVNKFGEPSEKGGGMSSKLDIWLRFTGFQVELPDRNWDTAKDSQWASLTIFES